MIAMELTWGLRIIGFSVIFRAGQKDVRSFERVTMRTLRRHSRNRGEGPLGPAMQSLVHHAAKVGIDTFMRAF